MLKVTVLEHDGTRLEIGLEEGRRYRLRWGEPGSWRVVYEGDARAPEGDALAHRRTVGGRTTSYAFRSVEQLRYDFERDAEEAQAARR